MEKKEKKKISFGDVVNSVMLLIGSRLVFGGLLAFLGIRVALDPNSAPKKIAWGLGLAIIIAMVGLLAGYITSKNFKRTNLIPIIETIVFTIIGAVMIIFSNALGPLVQVLFFLAVIICCITNLLLLIDFGNIREKRIEKKKNAEAKVEKNSVVYDVNNAVKADFVRYNGELLNAADYVKRKTDGATWAQIIIDIVLIVTSLVMIVTHFAGMKAVYFISGIVMTISGLNEIILGFRVLIKKRKIVAESDSENGEESGEE
ncbi:MAG: hypothetical protein J5819_07025 [Eubacterium sp.]|nr:hypothetical protein [Eubacterium sp.]